MKTRPHHEMHNHINALLLAQTIARRTGERQRVELIPNRRHRFDYRWRVVPVKPPVVDA